MMSKKLELFGLLDVNKFSDNVKHFSIYEAKEEIDNQIVSLQLACKKPDGSYSASILRARSNMLTHLELDSSDGGYLYVSYTYGSTVSWQFDLREVNPSEILDHRRDMAYDFIKLLYRASRDTRDGIIYCLEFKDWK